MKKLTNDQIIYYLKTINGESQDEIYELLCSNFQGQINYILNKYNFYQIPYERIDIELELKLLLVGAMRNYDMERHQVEFSLYYYSLCVSYISKLFRKYNRKKRKPKNLVYFEDVVAGSQTYTDVVCDPSDVDEIYVTKFFYRKKLREIKCFLSESDYEIFVMYLEGAQYKDISLKYDLTLNQVKSRLATIKKKIKNRVKK